MIVFDGTGFEKPGLLGIAPAPACVFVTDVDVGQKLPQLHDTALGELAAVQESDQVFEDKTLIGKCGGRMLADFTGEKPAIHIFLQIRKRQRRLCRFLQTKW